MIPPKVVYRAIFTLADLVRGLGYDIHDAEGIEEAVHFLAVTALGRPN